MSEEIKLIAKYKETLVEKEKELEKFRKWQQDTAQILYDKYKEIERLNNKMNNIKKYLKTYDILPLIEKNNELFKIINDIYFILENSPEKVDRLKGNK